MELRLPLEVSPAREATCRAVFGTWGFFPDDARASHCPFVLTSFTGWSSEWCPGIGFLSRGDREIGVLRNVEAPMRPRLECRRETGLIPRCDRKVGNPLISAMTGESRGGSRAAAPGCGFSRGTTARSVSLSWGAREVGSPCEWRGGARHCSRVMVGESGLETC